MILKDKNILVVGAAGLLGVTLVKELLSLGATVIAADINTSKLEKEFKELLAEDSN